jgi:chromosome segregation ATPase
MQYGALKSAYERRLQSLLENMRNIHLSVQQDHVVSALQGDPLTASFASGHVQETVAGQIAQERERYIQQLIVESSKSQARAAAAERDIQSFDRKLRGTAHTIARLEQALQLGKQDLVNSQRQQTETGKQDVQKSTQVASLATKVEQLEAENQRLRVNVSHLQAELTNNIKQTGEVRESGAIIQVTLEQKQTELNQQAELLKHQQQEFKQKEERFHLKEQALKKKLENTKKTQHFSIEELQEELSEAFALKDSEATARAEAEAKCVEWRRQCRRLQQEAQAEVQRLTTELQSGERAYEELQNRFQQLGSRSEAILEAEAVENDNFAKQMHHKLKRQKQKYTADVGSCKQQLKTCEKSLESCEVELQRTHSDIQQYRDTCAKLQDEMANIRNSEVEVVAMADVKIAKLESEILRIQDIGENAKAELQARLENKEHEIRTVREAYEDRIRELKERVDMETAVSQVNHHAATNFLHLVA